MFPVGPQPCVQLQTAKDRQADTEHHNAGDTGGEKVGTAGIGLSGGGGGVWAAAMVRRDANSIDGREVTRA